MFDGVGGGEWLVLLAVLLVVTGPKSLPKVVRELGRCYAKFRRMAEHFRRELADMEQDTVDIESKFPQ